MTNEKKNSFDESYVLNNKFHVNEDYILREVCGEYVLIPTGETPVFGNSMITLNDSFVILWRLFSEDSTGREVLDKIIDIYDGNKEEMKQDVLRFVIESLNNGLLEER